MKKPYIKKYKEVDGLIFYIVDGNYIRNFIDDQFTDFALHERFHFIPCGQAWIDRQTGGKKEYNYFVTNILAERKALKSGQDIWQAGDVGSVAEKKARRFEIKKPIKIKILYKYANIIIWLVRGAQVRLQKDVNFTQGGHDRVYSYIKPKKGQGEIWIDDEVPDPQDREDIALHEMHERNDMELGQSYGHGNRVTGAHASASFEEKLARRNPELLKSLVEKEKEIARIIYEEGTGESARKHIKDLEKGWNRAIKFDICRQYRRPKYGKRVHRHTDKSLATIK
jgi:hypothetical protein